MSTVVIYWSALFANKLEQDQAQQNIGLHPNPNCLALSWYSPRIFFNEVIEIKGKKLQTMNRPAKLPSMHIDNCWVDLCELYMIVTVHGSDHKKSKCIKYHKWLQERQAGRQAGRRAKSCKWLSCILSYLAPYLQHTEGVHQSIIIIINHYFPPPEKC